MKFTLLLTGHAALLKKITAHFINVIPCTLRAFTDARLQREENLSKNCNHFRIKYPHYLLQQFTPTMGLISDSKHKKYQITIQNSSTVTFSNVLNSSCN